MYSIKAFALHSYLNDFLVELKYNYFKTIAKKDFCILFESWCFRPIVFELS